MAMAKEVFHFGSKRYDIERARGLAARVRRTSQLNVEDAAKWIGLLITVDEAHAETVDLAQPVIVATVVMDKQTWSMPIDGWHRIYKAHKEGIKFLPSKVLSVDNSRKCVIK